MNEIAVLIEDNEPDLALREATVESQNTTIGNVITVRLQVEYTVTSEIFNVQFFKVRDVS